MRARAFLLILTSLACFAPGRLAAMTTWRSAATGQEVAMTLLEPPTAPTAAQSTPVILYLTALAAPRIGTDSDDAIIADFRAAGFLVAVIDYRSHPRARWPQVNRDLADLRAQLHEGKLLAGRKIDAAHIYIVPSGHRLKRDVIYFGDGTRTWAMDILYPANPKQPVGSVLEFSCDNANRMGNFSLQYCTDTLLEGAAIEGFAVAMADHPVPAPYQGLDPMPDSARKVQAAVRTLRAAGAPLGLNRRIVTLGFSRGSGMALLAATLGSRAATRPGLHGDDRRFDHDPNASAAVEGAVVLSGRFTYLDLLPDDAMIPRYTAAWGDPVLHRTVWREHGALDQLHAPTVPLFLSINHTESPHALHQMTVLRDRLAGLRSPFEFHPETEPRGHRMPLAAEVLDPMLSYLRERLTAPAESTRPKNLPNPN